MLTAICFTYLYDINADRGGHGIWEHKVIYTLIKLSWI